MEPHRIGILVCIVVCLVETCKATSADSAEAVEILSNVDVEGKKAYHFVYSDILTKTAEDNDVQETLQTNTGLSQNNTGAAQNITGSQARGMMSRQIMNSSVDLRWPHATVPYEIDSSFGDLFMVKSMMDQAFETWSNMTCVQFWDIRDTNHANWNETLGHSDFVRIIPGHSCGSNIGRKINGGFQTVVLKERGCMVLGTILHELGHLLGLAHEQSRSDRDEHININVDNIRPAFIHNFSPLDTIDATNYDYNSIMHYGVKDFSNNNLETISLKDSNLNFLTGQRSYLTYYDIMAINKAYRCDADCSGDDTCVNEGYRSKTCGCICPPTLGGPTCDSIATDWQGSGCNSGVIALYDDDFTEITSPNFPASYGNAKCSWLVKGPVGHTISISVEMADVPRNKHTHRCYHSIEIRYNLLGQQSLRFCGYTTFPYTFESIGDKVLIILHAGDTNYLGKNFKIKLGSGLQKNACLSSPCTGLGEMCVEMKGAGKYKCQCMGNFVGPSCSALDYIVCPFDGHEGPLPMCIFTQNLEDDRQWLKRSGSTPSFDTGPSKDVSEHGYYYYLESSRPAATGHTAGLDSILIAKGVKCFSFFYHMYGNTMGELYVRMTSVINYRWTRTWMKVGDQGDVWHHALFTINAATDFTIHITAVRGSGHRSDIAIDSISLTNEACYPLLNTPIFIYSLSPETQNGCELFYTGDNCDLINEAFCNFDNDDLKDLCIFSNPETNQYNWVKHKGATSSFGTGPHDDVSGDKYYLYAEASKPAKKGYVAKLETPFIQAGTVCIYLQLYMYGNTIMSVVIKFEDSASNVYSNSRSGNNGPKWFKVWFKVQSANNFKMTIKVTRGRTFRSDVGFDDFILSRQDCPADISPNMVTLG